MPKIASYQFRMPIAIWIALVCFVGWGCDQRDPNGKQPLSGTVVWSGAPLANGSIQFVSGSPQGMRTGALIQNGKFDIAQKDGLVPGEYRVVINSPDNEAEPVPMEEAPGPGIRVSPERIPANYNIQTELTADVSGDRDNVFDFNLVP